MPRLLIDDRDWPPHPYGTPERRVREHGEPSDPDYPHKGSRYAQGLSPDKTNRVVDSETRLPEYKTHTLAILTKATEPLSRHAITQRLKGEGFKAKRTMAGGYEDRALGTQRALEQLEAEGKVRATTGDYGEALWSRRD